METPEPDLIKAAQSGDRGAFEALYHRHVGRIYALCLRLAADSGRAQELTQDVFVQAWRKLSTFRGDSSLASWLHRMAVNAALGQRRSQRRQDARMAFVSDLEESAAVAPPAPPGGAPAIDLERAIATLPPQARTVFVLHDIEGYQHAEIAACTGLAVGTSKAHLHRARRLLREVLSR